ncbi:hypothetical protein KAU11_08740 [Candidatus Babeliales bacterium]|nr:hypothetical protein [Candidatus Babeliales bacterium]
MLTNKQINCLLRDVDSVVKQLSRNVNNDLRDDFAQELRIKIWLDICNNGFDSLMEAEEYVQDNIWLFNRQALQSLYKQCRKMHKHLKYRNKPYHCAVNDIELSEEPKEPSIIEFVLSKLEEKDAEIGALLLDTGGKDIYNEQTCSGFGYTSRAGFHKRIQRVRQLMLEICAEYGLFTEKGGES